MQSKDRIERPRAILACMLARNERLRLPTVLEHHRRLGVDRFLIVDDRSTDGTSEFLNGQPDVTVLEPQGSYGEAKSGVDWINATLDAHAHDHWVLVLDADELFVYPGCETVGLRALCDHLDGRGARGALALLVDMYGPDEIRRTHYEAGASLIDAAPWFDPGPYQAVRGGRFPHVQAFGGPRARAFDFSPHQPRPPVLTKAPLVRWSPGMRYELSTHALTPIPMAPLMFGLLHFKFLADFPERVAAAVREGQHYGGSQEYRVYQAALEQRPALALRDARSIRYRDSRQLVEQALMHVDASYDAFVADLQAA